MRVDELAGQVARLLKNQDAIIFLGAGVSLGTPKEQEDDLGMPSSTKLAKMIAEEFHVPFRDGRSELDGIAALAVEEAADPASVKAFVADAILDRAKTTLRTHKALARVAPPLVLTTNYDSLYEKALDDRGVRYGKIVHQGQLSAPAGRPRVVKLHGDAEDHTTLVLTGEDYMRWETEAAGLVTDVTASFQRSPCVFVGYSLRDPNLRRIVGLVRSRLGPSARRHFALVHEVDQEDAAWFGGGVRFVQGDATTFLELLADLSAQEEPPAFDLAEEERTLERLIQADQLVDGLESCKRLQAELERRGLPSTAAQKWVDLATAAEESSARRVAAVARTRAGDLYLEAREESLAESSLRRALEHARAANMPPQEREILPFLYRARLSGGHYHQFLQDTDRALGLDSADEFLDRPYRLRSGRAEAKEALGDDDGALSELGDALEDAPQEEVFLRANLRCSVARIFATQAKWDAAREELDSAAAELSTVSPLDTNDTERRRGDALVNLVRANVHRALGEDLRAVELYQGCEGALSETGDEALAISALKGTIYCKQMLGDFELGGARARLQDLLRTSPEYRRMEEVEQAGVTALAAGRLAEARSELLRAMTAAQAVHDSGRERSIRHWYADVLLAAGNAPSAFQQYVLAGDKKNSAEVAAGLTRLVSEDSTTFDRIVAGTVEAAFADNLPARRAALAALASVSDVLPDTVVATLPERLASMDDLPAGFWADRNLLSEAAELAEKLAPLLTDAQALDIGRGIIRAVRRNDCFHVTYGRLCSALSELAVNHAGIVEQLEVPVERLAELTGRDLINDTRNAMAALVNLARKGHERAREKALELARSDDTPWHIRWRYWLSDISEAELSATIRVILAQAIDRVQQTRTGFQYDVGGLSPMFFKNWTLPETVRAEVVDTLSEAAGDHAVLIRDRQEAANMLGYKAKELGDEGRRQAIRALLPLLTEVEIHPVARSIDNPLSAMIMNVGQPEDIKGAAAYSLLRLSGSMSGEQRALLMREIERLRASQVEALGVSVSGGLRLFEPASPEEQRWLQTRLLLLMNTPHAAVRDNAAQCVGLMVEAGSLEFDPEIVDTLLHMASSALVSDRAGAADAIARSIGKEGWHSPETSATLDRLRQDRSYEVRSAASRHHESNAETPTGTSEV
jgi:tetratricopeptide (TPR) repeat protein